MSRKSNPVRAQLSHPVVDADAHWQEPWPVFADYIATVGGAKMVDRIASLSNVAESPWYAMSPEERIARQSQRPPFWGGPTVTEEYATALLPRMLYDRLEEFGIDFGVVYTTKALGAMRAEDPDLRRAWCRAYNMMIADSFRGLEDKLTPVAVIPAFDPREAVDELRFVTDELNLRSIVINGHAVRTLKDSEPGSWGKYLDFLGMDSPEGDFDPFWQECVDRKVPVTSHGFSLGWPTHNSPSSFMFNHIGMFGQSNQGFCRALCLGGVPGRFPELRFGFLESGVTWACGLLGDTREHFERRNLQSLNEHLKPTNLDTARFGSLWEEYASPEWQRLKEAAMAHPWGTALSSEQLTDRDLGYDEWARMESLENLSRWFANNFYFGCESEDKTMSFVFNNHLGVRLKPTLGSDIGHWDVAVMADVLHEGYELVERGVLTEGEFAEFTYENPVRLYTDQNPDFFVGTAVEKDVQALLGTTTTAAR